MIVIMIIIIRHECKRETGEIFREEGGRSGL
jgi:hypothetical protein